MFSVGGMSECGKSYAGKFLAERGVARIKIAKVLADVGEELGHDPEAEGFTSRLYDLHFEPAMELFLTKAIQMADAAPMAAGCLESMYRPAMARYLTERLGAQMVHIYIEVPLDVRLERQFQAVQNIFMRLGLPPDSKGSAEVRAELDAALIERDAMKTARGVPELRPLATHIIDNSGTLESYNDALESVLKAAGIG